MKSININRSNGIVRIDVVVDLNNRKSQLHISKKLAETNYNKVLNKVKIFSKFNALSLCYNEIDYYDNLVDIYETPYIHFIKGKGKRKPTISSQEHGCIPKDWSQTFTLSLNDPKTIKPIEIFLLEFGIKLSKKQIKEVRKAVKGESCYFTEI